MELELTDDQELLRETTRRFLETSCPVATVRELADKEAAGYERDWWRRGAELGWTSMLVPAADGGGNVSGHGLLDLVLVVEEMGRQVSPGPVIPCNVAGSAIAEGGAGAQRLLLPEIAAGEALVTWCLGVGAAIGLRPDAVAVRARRRGSSFVLDGSGGPAEGAEVADHVLVAAIADEGLTQFLVPATTPGLTVAPMESFDLVRRFGTVEFDAAEVPAGAVLGAVGGAPPALERQLQLAAVLQCAEMVGATDRAFEFTLEYAFDRYSFGRPLASYQALKHRFADTKLWLEACHATAGAAARAVDGSYEEAGELASVAKAYVGERAPLVLQDCVQLHGGIGVTWEHDLHLYLRRVVQDRSLLGTPSEHRARIAAIMGM